MREANEGWAVFVARLVSSRYSGKQSALAEAIGVSPSTVTRWIDGATPAIQQLRAISDTLGYTMAELLHAAGALDAGDGAEVSSPTSMLVDVPEAIRQDDSLLEEAKQHLLNQYELLLRLQPAAARTRVEKTARRASTSPDASQLRAVARGGDPKDRAEVQRLAREARRQHQQDTGKKE